MYDELIKRLRELQAITEHCSEQLCYECENIELCDKYDNKTLSGTYKDAADAIEELSKPLDAHEIRHGRWMVDGCDATCSNCRNIFCGDWDGLDLIADCDMRYCPNCGAMMTEEGE